MNKSLATNLLAVAVAALGGVTPPPLGPHLLAVGLFAASGAITNWLAIHMLFEKVPGLYGSGVIPSRFREFKAGIRALIMDQFFTRENVERFFASGGAGGFAVDADRVRDAVDYEAVWGHLVATVRESAFGGMLSMFGGESALDPLRGPFVERMELVVGEIVSSDRFADALSAGLESGETIDSVIGRVGGVVDGRLDELTPRMVKEIIQEMIRRHLGWLVVWGGVFGGTIGLVTSLFRA